MFSVFNVLTTLAMAINDDLIYEVNEQGEQVLVKSVASTHRAYLRFSNKTKRPVDVWWRDFNGQRRFYTRLEAGAYYDVNSFITHPWEFCDAGTKEPYLIDNKNIFRAPEKVGGMLYRTNWNISIGMRSLRQTALLEIAVRTENSAQAFELGLPRCLQAELKELIDKINNVVQAPCD